MAEKPLPARLCSECRLPLRVLFDGPLGTVYDCAECHSVVMVSVGAAPQKQQP
jgi:hypothetical protein